MVETDESHHCGHPRGHHSELAPARESVTLTRVLQRQRQAGLGEGCGAQTRCAGHKEELKAG